MRKPILKMLLGMALLASISSCQDKEPELSLPPITQDGRNTLGFNANGQVWVNYGEVCNYLDCEENIVEGRLHKNADGTFSLIVRADYRYTSKDKKNQISQSFSLTVNNVSNPGTYTLTPAHQDMASMEVNMNQNDFYHLVNNSSITLNITRLDKVNNIVSGQFEGVMAHYSDASKTMTITKGRFDTKLTYSE